MNIDINRDTLTYLHVFLQYRELNCSLGSLGSKSTTTEDSILSVPGKSAATELSILPQLVVVFDLTFCWDFLFTQDFGTKSSTYLAKFVEIPKPEFSLQSWGGLYQCSPSSSGVIPGQALSRCDLSLGQILFVHLAGSNFCVRFFRVFFFSVELVFEANSESI